MGCCQRMEFVESLENTGAFSRSAARRSKSSKLTKNSLKPEQNKRYPTPRSREIFEYSESFASESEGLCVATLYKAAQKDGFKKFANYLEFIFHLDFIVKKLFTRV